MPSLLLVALRAARAMDDDLDSPDGGIDAIAGPDVPGHELDTLILMGGPTEHPDVAAGIAQACDDEPPKRARAAGYEDGCRCGHGLRFHRESPCHVRRVHGVT